MSHYKQICVWKHMEAESRPKEEEEEEEREQ